MSSVAKDPYALTLYTCWHLRQLDRVQEFDDVLARFDLAVLFAYSRNAPEELAVLQDRFLSQYRTKPSAQRGASTWQDTVRRLEAHRTMTQTPPPPGHESSS